jgi:hypothetical protein
VKVLWAVLLRWHAFVLEQWECWELAVKVLWAVLLGIGFAVVSNVWFKAVAY